MTGKRIIKLTPRSQLKATVHQPGQRRVVSAVKTTFVSTVQKFGGRVTSIAPIYVKNQITEIGSIDDIPGINISQREDGASIVWNANTGEYDVRLLTDFDAATINVATIGTVVANGQPGLPGQVLVSNGAGIYWADAPGGIDQFIYSSANNTLSITTTQSQIFTATINTVNNFTVTGNFDFNQIDGGEY